MTNVVAFPRPSASDPIRAARAKFESLLAAGRQNAETVLNKIESDQPVDRIARATALTFVEFHRFTAVSYKLPLLEAMVGAAIVMAKANGIDRAGHVRDKLIWLGGYAETVRGLTELAALRCKLENGVAYPDVFTTNMAKWTFAREFHQAIETLQELAGGLLVTGPGGMDWNSPDIRPVLEKYLPGAWPADRRMAIMNLISDLTTRLYGGYQAVLAIHAHR